MRTSPLHGEFEQLLLACSEGCGLRCCFHLRMRTVLTGTRLYIRSMLLVVFSHNNYYYPMIVTSNVLVWEDEYYWMTEKGDHAWTILNYLYT